MLYPIIITIHVIVCVFLILVVLLQAGRGGGMTDMLGSQTQNLFGTQTSEFMVKATEISAVLFIVTSLSLGVISTQRGKSLMERQRFPDFARKTASIPTPPAAMEQKAAEAAKASPAAEASATSADAKPAAIPDKTEAPAATT